MPDLYDHHSLTEAINIIPTPQTFILDKIFNNKKYHEDENVDCEIVRGSSKVAKYAAQEATEPHVVGKSSVKVVTFKIPRTFESKTWTIKELKDYNSLGDRYGSAAERKKLQSEIILSELEDLKNRVINLRVLMACKMLETGKLTVEQDDIKFEEDLGFVNNVQLITLSGTNLFDNAASDPIKSLRSWKKSIAKASNTAPTIALFGSTAADAFVANTKVKAALDNNNYKVGSLDLTTDPEGGVEYLGRIAGLDCYEITSEYVNSSGSATPMISADRAIVVAPSKNHRMHIGPVFRRNGNAIDTILSEFYLEVDEKSGNQSLKWNCEQRSIPFIHDPGLVVSAKVV